MGTQGAVTRHDSWATGVAQAEARHAAFARVQQMVHEGVHAMRAMPATMRPSPARGSWPAYLYEHDDHGAYEEARWKPTPRQIDWAFKTAVWYGLWRGRDRTRNGLHRWEWSLLEVRGWQAMFGRESWRDLADLMNARPGVPTYDHTHWRRHHNQLIEIGLNQAIKAGDVSLAA